VQLEVTHFSPTGQRVSQPPQRVGSALVSRHWPPQKLKPAGQAHAPARHAWFEGQLEPQLPQWRLLICRSTQPPSQPVFPAGQDDRHWPALHTRPWPQWFPHAPQLAASSLLFTQRVPHRTSAAAQAAPASGAGSGRTTQAPSSSHVSTPDRRIAPPRRLPAGSQRFGAAGVNRRQGAQRR